jgi:hypothetical protein
MVTTTAAQPNLNRNVGDPCDSYNNAKTLWMRSRAVCNGEHTAKAHDAVIDYFNYSNLLIPFSPKMTMPQYNFYRAEAELPGLVAQYSRIILGGLLRKKPTLVLPESIPEAIRKEATDWLMTSIGRDKSSMMAFLDEALWEEIQTSRAWIYVDYPSVPEDVSVADAKKYSPYPILWRAEDVINWRVGTNLIDGSAVLDRVIVKSVEDDFENNEWHPEAVYCVYVHELDENGLYQIRVYKSKSDGGYVLHDTITNLLVNGERMTMIPAWPLNGSIEPQDPLLLPLIDREVALYNKVSRRNHLMYGAATYTPVLSANITDEQFDAIVDSGLGTWIRLNQGDTATILDTPTDALKDMETSIAATVAEMARMGMRMLSPESGEQSGIALEIRNAAQTAQLGNLNTRVSTQFADIIAFMINWKYDLEVNPNDIEYTLTNDFNPAPLGADWLRLITEWYDSGKIPRSVFLEIAKLNDIIPPDYDDNEGQAEINSDELIATNREQSKFESELEVMNKKLNSKPPAKNNN